MILAVPYHPDLPVDYKRLAADFRKFSGNKNHTILILSRPQDEDAAYEVAMNLSPNFGRSFNASLLKEGATQIETSNAFFQTALRFLKTYKREKNEPEGMPLLYLDPNWRPKDHRWMDELQSEYFLQGAPGVMGVIGHRACADFTAGVVIGPKYLAKSTLLDFLPPSAHWRKYLHDELCLHAVPTKSILDYLTIVMDKKATASK